MFEVSDEYLEVIRGDNRVFPTRVKFDGIDEYFTNKNLRNGSYTNTIDGNKILSMGNACSNKIEFTISNYNKPFIWKGARFTVEKGLRVLGETVWVPWGTFWVTDIRTSNDKRTIDITGYDLMYRLSKQKYVTALVAPFHYRDLLDEFLALSGLTLSTDAELPLAGDEDYTILSWPDGDFTFADIAGHLAGMACTNARISWADPSVIEFTWWTPTKTKIHKETRMNGFEKLADSPLFVDYLVTGPNLKIVIKNTEGKTDGALDFSQFDTPAAEDLPMLAFTYDDAALTASVSLAEDYKGDQSAINIPARVRYNDAVYTVTSIPAAGFQHSTAISITMPYTLTTIGDNAFQYCRSLVGVTIPGSVNAIARRAFDGCTALLSISIGLGVTTISDYAFYGCTALRELTIPDSVTSIGNYAFGGCSSLTRAQIGTSDACAISGMRRYTFGSCSALQTITIYAVAGSLSYQPWGAGNATVEYMIVEE